MPSTTYPPTIVFDTQLTDDSTNEVINGPRTMAAHPMQPKLLPKHPPKHSPADLLR